MRKYDLHYIRVHLLQKNKIVKNSQILQKFSLYYLNSRRSSEDEGDNESQTTIDSGARGQDPHSATSSISGIGTGTASGGLHLPGGLAPADLEHLEELAKQSCYDSGIDIREPIPNLQPIPKKTVYSDADIVLSSDWVPPKTISPTLMSESPPRSSVLSAQSLDAGTAGGRKKTSSVSFSVDDNNSEQQAVAAVAASAAAAAAQGDKNAEKKNKVYPKWKTECVRKRKNKIFCAFADVETLIISFGLGWRPNWRSRRPSGHWWQPRQVGGLWIGAQHGRFESERIFESIFKVSSLTYKRFRNSFTVI